MVDSYINLKNPHKVFEALASKPMTKWELMKKTGLLYPRIHDAVSLLENGGYVKTLDVLTSKRGREMKLIGLTFKGIITYLSSIWIVQKDEIDNQAMPETEGITKIIVKPTAIEPLRKDESLESYRERKEKEKEQYLKELEKITLFLEIYGKALDYPLFKEIRWLNERYGHDLLETLMTEAKIVNALQPFPSGPMQLMKYTEKKLGELKKRRWSLIREPSNKIQMRTIQNEKVTDVTDYEPLADVNEQIKDAEQQLSILRSQENKWWSMGFAARFAMEHNFRKRNSDLHNAVLSRFFEQVALHFRKIEVEPAEKMAQVFS